MARHELPPGTRRMWTRCQRNQAEQQQHADAVGCATRVLKLATGKFEVTTKRRQPDKEKSNRVDAVCNAESLLPGRRENAAAMVSAGLTLVPVLWFTHCDFRCLGERVIEFRHTRDWMRHPIGQDPAEAQNQFPASANSENAANAQSI